MTEKIWKVTLYMTNEQWEELSKWSAPITPPWLYMEHEPSPKGEYEEKKQALDESIPGEMIYTTER